MNLAALAVEHSLDISEVRARWLTHRVALWKSDFVRFCHECVKIRSKEGVLVPLSLNSAQMMLHTETEKMLKDEKWVRLIGLKGRRQGFSTYVGARGYWRSTLWDLQRSYILAHEMSGTSVLFDMVALMQEHHLFSPAVGTDNAKELEFVKRGSSYTVATAGQKAGGRGGAISFFHGSEVAYWTNARDHFASSVQSVDEVRGVWGVIWRRPDRPLPFEREDIIYGWVQAPSEVFLESTSSGPSGEFYRRYMEAVGSIGRYRHVFVPWSVQTEYALEGEGRLSSVVDDLTGPVAETEYAQMYKLSLGQMLWRREKIQELGSYRRFQQEYPSDSSEAFSSTDVTDLFIEPSIVLRAVKRTLPLAVDAPLIIGVDCAGGGGDRFAVAGRRGDVCLWVKWRSKIDHETAVAWLSSLIEEEKPSRMCIDRGSMGAAIVTSLRNVSPACAAIVRGVDFGGTSSSKKINPGKAGPVNVRAEIYNRLRDWLGNGCLPDLEDLRSDISAPKIKYRTNNDWLLESKSDMKARGLRSPDLSDALALTFSFNEWFSDWKNPVNKSSFEAPQLHEVQAYDGGNNGWMG